MPRAPRAKRPAVRPKTVAVALGGGGARGLAHIAVIEALDEIGVRPAAIAGTSIGALVGAAWAAGMTGREIRRYVIGLAHDRAEIWRRLARARIGAIAELFSVSLGNPVLVDAEKFCALFLPEPVPETFEALAVPLTVVATDLHGRREQVFEHGPLRPALAASMAVPGLIRPVAIDGRVLVDGGAVDPLPFEHLRAKADIVLAVDISGGRPDGGDAGIPDPWNCLFATLTVMGHAIVGEKLKRGAPDIVVRPAIGSFRMLDFFHASAILRAAEPVKAEVKEALGALLAA